MILRFSASYVAGGFGPGGAHAFGTFWCTIMRPAWDRVYLITGGSGGGEGLGEVGGVLAGDAQGLQGGFQAGGGGQPDGFAGQDDDQGVPGAVGGDRDRVGGRRLGGGNVLTVHRHLG